MPATHRWSADQRLEFIEFRLYWDGQINRSDLVKKFSISVPQASADLARYLEIAPGNLRYDTTRKAYRATEAFTPMLTPPAAGSYFTLLQRVADGAVAQRDTWLGWTPPYAVVPLVRRRLDATTLRTVLDAIHHASALHIEYQSFSSPEPSRRWISPHALGFDGARWHVRAYCWKRDEFRDFVLARFVKINNAETRPVDASRDAGWNTMVTLRLGPHPGLDDAQKRAIERDYGMENGFVEIRTRVCLSYYLERRLGLDLERYDIPPPRLQIVLLNRGELEDVRNSLSIRHRAA